MEKLMKGIFVGLMVVLALSSTIETVVSVSRHEWASLLWLAIAVIGCFGLKESIKEYKAND